MENCVAHCTTRRLFMMLPRFPRLPLGTQVYSEHRSEENNMMVIYRDCSVCSLLASVSSLRYLSAQ